jgi:hypothetical protein
MKVNGIRSIVGNHNIDIHEQTGRHDIDAQGSNGFGAILERPIGMRHTRNDVPKSTTTTRCYNVRRHGHESCTNIYEIGIIQNEQDALPGFAKEGSVAIPQRNWMRHAHSKVIDGSCSTLGINGTIAYDQIQIVIANRTSLILGGAQVQRFRRSSTQLAIGSAFGIRFRNES